jgi:putative FmdB family regulatory protein
MLTYEYKCEKCGLRFKRRQAITEAPITKCPDCQGNVHRLVSGGAGYMFKGQDQGRAGHGGGACSLEQSGRTCCGRSKRCGQPACGD